MKEEQLLNRKDEVIGGLNRLIAFLNAREDVFRDTGEYLASWVNQLPRLSITHKESDHLDSLRDRANFAADVYANLSTAASNNPTSEVRKERLWHGKSHLDRVVGEITLSIKGMLRRDYCRRHDLRPSNRRYFACAHVLLDQRHPSLVSERRTPFLDGSVSCRPPSVDHNSLFRRKDGPLVFVSQPYDRVERLKHELEAWTARWGLTFRLAPEESWHFPGHTILYEVRKE
jgi:hypothetical protein